MLPNFHDKLVLTKIKLNTQIYIVMKFFGIGLTYLRNSLLSDVVTINKNIVEALG